MTLQELLIFAKNKHAFMSTTPTIGQITLTNKNLQRINSATLPEYMIELYKICGGIRLGSACIFGPNEIKNSNKYPVPTIFKINEELFTNKNIKEKTIFGRNDLFLFAFDNLGKCFLLDNTSLKPLKQYTDPYKAMADCITLGKL